MLQKKGVSAIVATVLVILITVAAGALLLQFVVPFVRDTLNGSTRCSEYQNYFTFDDSQGFDCLQTGSNALLSIRAKSIENVANGTDQTALNNSVTGITLFFKGASGSETVKIPESGNIRMVSLNPIITLPNPGELRTYNISLDNLYKSVEMHVVVGSAMCKEVSDSMNQIKSRCV